MTWAEREAAEIVARFIKSVADRKRREAEAHEAELKARAQFAEAQAALAPKPPAGSMPSSMTREVACIAASFAGHCGAVAARRKALKDEHYSLCSPPEKTAMLNREINEYNRTVPELNRRIDAHNRAVAQRLTGGRPNSVTFKVFNS